MLQMSNSMIGGKVGFSFTFKGQINLFGLLPLC